jgi:hypothetical protein
MGACSRALACCRRVAVAAADCVAVRVLAALSVVSGLRRGARLRVIVLWCVAPVIAAAGALLALAVPRQAGADPSPAPTSLAANCGVAAGTATCTFAEVGAVQSFVVPAGVDQIVVAAAGAQGADGSPSRDFNGSVPGGAGGSGGIQRGALAVSGGQTLEVFVGGPGGSDESGGFNGGGGGVSAGRVAGGGGGASDVRTQPFGMGDRVIVGGGGGGGAGGLNDSIVASPGAAGAAGGADGAGSPGGARLADFGGGGGGAGGTGSGGAGGSAGQFPNGDSGNAGGAGGAGSLGQGGALGTGGAPGPDTGVDGTDGGGGGGGYDGGGGGGGGASDDTITTGGGGGGGGGGSSFILPSAASPASTTGAQAGSGSVQISFAVSAPQITSPSTATFLVGRAGSFKVIATGVPTPSLSEAGLLPAGVTFTDNGDGTATLTGTPASDGAGSYQLRLTAAGAVSPDATQSFTLIVPVASLGAPPPSPRRAPPTRPSLATAPAISGTAKVGHVLSCGTGSWSGGPTSFSYSWSRNGTPIGGAVSARYKVRASDEGSVLRCTVVATNPVGASPAAVSAAIRIAVPHIARCPRATGVAAGRALGLVKLGDTRAEAEHAYSRSSSRGTRFEEFFCLTPIGIRVGYASPKLLAKLPAKRRNTFTARVIWISSANPFYAIQGVRPGASVTAATARLKLSKAFEIGLNDSYLAPDGPVTAVLKSRAGIVEEIGIADKRLTQGRTAQRNLLTSFF